ncbi:MAG: hypothetical protein ACX94B_13175 [Henriciella sp.]
MKIEPIKYSRVKGKTRYWEPSRKLRSLGFTAKKWKEGPEGREAARMETARAMKALDTGQARPTYGEGTLAHYWIAVYYPRKQKDLKIGLIKPRTLEEYRTAWIHINAKLGRRLIENITVDDCKSFFAYLTEQHSPAVRRRCIAKLKDCLKNAVADRLIASNPASVIVNPGVKPRRAYYQAHEIEKLIGAATEAGMVSMSLCIRLMYETARAPVDARLLTLPAIRRDQSGPYIDRSREKTGVEGYQEISEELYEDIMAYVSGLDVHPLPETPIFRQHKPKRGTRVCVPWADESDFAKDFAKVRKLALGPNETRKAMDIRRTANLEASLGDATAEDRARLLANSLDRNKDLDNVYTPPTLAAARKANAARTKGRDVLRSAQGKTRTS